MDTETILDEIIENGSRKIMLGFRCYPELKYKQTKKAESLGISLSESIENDLLNVDTILEGKLSAANELTVAKSKLLQLTALANNNNVAFQAEIDKLKSENNELKKNESNLFENQKLFSHPRLLELFSKLKGKKDTIESADGKRYSITYNHPRDLLIAMIYSFKTK